MNIYQVTYIRDSGSCCLTCVGALGARLPVHARAAVGYQGRPTAALANVVRLARSQSLCAHLVCVSA